MLKVSPFQVHCLDWMWDRKYTIPQPYRWPGQELNKIILIMIAFQGFRLAIGTARNFHLLWTLQSDWTSIHGKATTAYLLHLARSKSRLWWWWWASFSLFMAFSEVTQQVVILNAHLLVFWPSFVPKVDNPSLMVRWDGTLQWYITVMWGLLLWQEHKAISHPIKRKAQLLKQLDSHETWIIGL